ncbi:hypothetical protein DFJ73DRAFT_142451 [Zopfochytrium polystomum]|nr:hypothetical protein DFJ73DRAFT_142451 [Zopfochytrium polystomum]
MCGGRLRRHSSLAPNIGSIRSFFIDSADPNFASHKRFLPDIARNFSSYTSRPISRVQSDVEHGLNAKYAAATKSLGPAATNQDRSFFSLLKSFGATALMTDFVKQLELDDHNDAWYDKIARLFHGDAVVQINGITKLCPSGEYRGENGVKEFAQVLDSLRMKIKFKILNEADFAFSTDLARFNTDLTRSVPHLEVGLIGSIHGSFEIGDLKKHSYKLTKLVFELHPLSRLQQRALDDYFEEFANDFRDYVDGTKILDLRELMTGAPSDAPAISQLETSSSGMTTLGVRLSFFHTFIKKCGTRAAFRGLTTADVNAKIVQPATLYAKASLVDCMIALGDTSAIGPADWFVSHAWMYSFLDVVDSLDRFFENADENTDGESSDPYLWFDLFTNSQHDTAAKPFEFWETTFMSAVKKIGRVLMVLQPHSAPIPFARSWCVFEMFSCLKTGSLFDVTMTAYQSSLFSEMVANTSTMCKILDLIDTANSQSTNPADRAMIFQSVTNGGLTLPQIDEMVKGAFCEWMIRECKRRLALSALPSDRAMYRAAIAVLLELRRDASSLDEAEELRLCSRMARPDSSRNTELWLTIGPDGRAELPDETSEAAFSHYIRLYKFCDQMQHFYRRCGRFERAIPFARAAAYTDLAQDALSPRALWQFCLLAFFLDRCGQPASASYWFDLVAYIVKVASLRQFDDVKRLGNVGLGIAAILEPDVELTDGVVTAGNTDFLSGRWRRKVLQRECSWRCFVLRRLSWSPMA